MSSMNSVSLGVVRTSVPRGLRVVTALALTFGLSACMEGGNFPMFQDKAAEGSEDVSTRRATRLIERDVEAPEVFQVTEAGLWDGRPSLGGVWVAHPDVKEPERVLIRNTSNDKFVIGALFRRERENPGPRLQVSSDAAAALGLLAGGPQNLNVTALRREEVPTETAPETAADALPEAEGVEEQALDPIASAAQAIDKAEGKETPAPAPVETAVVAEPAPAPATEGPADPTVTGAALAAADGAAEMAPAPKKPNFFSKLFKKKQKPATAALTAGDDIETTTLSAPEVETMPLDARSPAALAGEATVQPVSAPAPAPSPRANAALSKPYLQIGIFSVEENAENTATAMRQAGMIPTVRKQTTQGKTFWRVLIGPATTSAERSGLLEKVKASGFTDAYAVTN